MSQKIYLLTLQHSSYFWAEIKEMINNQHQIVTKNKTRIGKSISNVVLQNMFSSNPLRRKISTKGKGYYTAYAITKQLLKWLLVQEIIFFPSNKQPSLKLVEKTASVVPSPSLYVSTHYVNIRSQKHAQWPPERPCVDRFLENWAQLLRPGPNYLTAFFLAKKLNARNIFCAQILHQKKQLKCWAPGREVECNFLYIDPCST